MDMKRQSRFRNFSKNAAQLHPVFRFCIRLDVEHIVVHRKVDLLSIHSGVEVVITLKEFQLGYLRQDCVDLFRIAGRKRNNAKNSEVELTLAVQSSIDFHLIGRAAGATGRSKACAVEIFDHGKRAGLKSLLGRRRKFGCDDARPLLFNDACRFSPSITSNPGIRHSVER